MKEYLLEIDKREMRLRCQDIACMQYLDIYKAGEDL